MLVGGFAAFLVVISGGSLWVAVLVAALVGVLMGLLMSFISVTLKAEQGISGIGLYMFGLGLSSLLFKVLVGTVKTVEGFPPVKIPLLGDIPYPRRDPVPATTCWSTARSCWCRWPGGSSKRPPGG